MARIAGSSAAATRVGEGLGSTALGLAAGRPRSGLEPDISARRACASMRGEMVARTDGSSGSAAALAARRREEPPPEVHTHKRGQAIHKGCRVGISPRAAQRWMSYAHVHGGRKCSPALPSFTSPTQTNS